MESDSSAILKISLETTFLCFMADDDSIGTLTILILSAGY